MLYSNETEEENMRRVLWGVLILLTTFAVQASYEPLWQYNCPESVVFAPTMAGDGSVFFATGDGKIRMVGPNGLTGWEVKVGGQVITPLVLQGGLLYFATSAKEVRAYGASNGKMAWKTEVDANAATPLALSPNGLIYFGGADGDLYCIGADGKTKWHVHLGSQVGPPTISRDGTVFCAGDNFMHAVNGDSGHVMWRKNFWNASKVPVAMDRYDDLFYIREGILDVYDVHGFFLWEFRDPDGTPILVKKFAPVIYGDIAVVANDGGGEIYGVDVSTGTILWTFSEVNTNWSPAVTSPMAVDRDGMVAYLDGSGVIAWFDAVTGAFYGYMPSMGSGQEAVLGGVGVQGRIVTRTGAGSKILACYAVPAGPGGPWSQFGMSPWHVQRSDEAPFCSIATPLDGEVISGSFTVNATASDDNAVKKVELYIGNAKVASSDVGTLLWSANSALMDDGTYPLTLLATDGAGNVGTDTITVTFSNPTPVHGRSQGPPTFAWLPNGTDNRYQVMISMEPTFTTPVVTSATDQSKWIRGTAWTPSNKKWDKVLSAANLNPSPTVPVYWRVIGKIGGEVVTRSFILDKAH
jgi:outer membrane protein assembly factor BamB